MLVCGGYCDGYLGSVGWNFVGVYWLLDIGFVGVWWCWGGVMVVVVVVWVWFGLVGWFGFDVCCVGVGGWKYCWCLGGVVVVGGFEWCVCGVGILCY